MPITLPNSGLVCPEPGDPNLQACQQVKELFTYVDGLPTSTDINDNQTVSLPSLTWAVQGDPTEKVFKQTVTVPTGVDPYKSAMTVIDGNGCVAFLNIDIVSVSSICVTTNTPTDYQLVFG